MKDWFRRLWSVLSLRWVVWLADVVPMLVRLAEDLKQIEAARQEHQKQWREALGATAPRTARYAATMAPITIQLMDKNLSTTLDTVEIPAYQRQPRIERVQGAKRLVYEAARQVDGVWQYRLVATQKA